MPCPQPTWRASAATASGPPDSARERGHLALAESATALLGRGAAGVREARRAASCAPSAGGRSPCRFPVGAPARGRGPAPSSIRGPATARGARARAARRPPARAAAPRAARAAGRSPPRCPPPRRAGAAARRHHEHAAHGHARHVSAQPVVERAAKRAGRGQRLDLGDHASNLRGGPDAGWPRRSRSGWTSSSCGIGRWPRTSRRWGCSTTCRASASARRALTLLRELREAGVPDDELRRAVALNQLVLLPVELALSEGERALHAGGGVRALRPRAGLPRSAEPGPGRAAPGARGAGVRRERRAPGGQRAADPGGGPPGRRDPRDRPRAGHGRGQPRCHGGHRLRRRPSSAPATPSTTCRPATRRSRASCCPCSSRAWARRCVCTSAR